MKKLSLKSLNLNADDMLQREQLKTVFGGYAGSCGYTALHLDGNGNSYRHTVYGVSQNEAFGFIGQAFNNGYFSARWCCDSCSSASWL